MNSSWRAINGAPLPSGPDYGVLGILNLTPDSFYDGGKFNKLPEALEHLANLQDEGAHVFDIGAESTRPYASPVRPDEELSILQSIVPLARKHFPETPLSIDTRNSLAAAWALNAGASIINDVSACEHDPALLDVLIEYKPGYVLMHSRGTPANMQDKPVYKDVLEEITRFFESKLNHFVARGLPEDRIILDPGIGFGKSLEHNLKILRSFSTFACFGRPLLSALSMKSLFGKLLNHPLDKRDLDTALTSVLLWKKGVFWHRVHKVGLLKDAFRLAQALEN